MSSITFTATDPQALQVQIDRHLARQQAEAAIMTALAAVARATMLAEQAGMMTQRQALNVYRNPTFKKMQALAEPIMRAQIEQAKADRAARLAAQQQAVQA